MKNNIKILNIDGIEYIRKSHYENLEKKKMPKPKAEKINLDSPQTTDFSIPDIANVCAIIPLNRKTNYSERTKIEIAEMGIFTEVKSPEITYYHNEKWDIDCFKINGCKFSKKYLDMMRKMSRIFYDDEHPRIFLQKPDYPGLFLFDNKLAFILAPRIDENES